MGAKATGYDLKQAANHSLRYLASASILCLQKSTPEIEKWTAKQRLRYFKLFNCSIQGQLCMG